MIHFDFVVTDAEAETIFDGLQDQVVACITEMLLVEGPSAAAIKAHLQQRVEYLKAIQAKMSHSRAPTSLHPQAGDVQSSSSTKVN